LIIVSLAGMLGCALCAPARPITAPGEPPAPDARASLPVTRESSPEPAPRVDFDKQIRPILEARCRPCHFEGGKMYGRLPFDRPQTIRNLGTRLFSRIKDDDAQTLIRSFLAEPGDLVPSDSPPSDGP
jgi:hypothetical protein